MRQASAAQVLLLAQGSLLYYRPGTCSRREEGEDTKKTNVGSKLAEVSSRNFGVVEPVVV